VTLKITKLQTSFTAFSWTTSLNRNSESSCIGEMNNQVYHCQTAVLLRYGFTI